MRAHQDGDPAAFGELFAAYQHQVLGYVRSLVGDPGLAEDLTQDTFVCALRGIGSVHDQGRGVAGWLFTIARNLVFSHYRTNRHRREVVADVADERPATDLEPQEWVCVQETRREVVAAFEQLPATHREILVLRFVEERSAIDTAHRTGRTCRTSVTTMQQRALRRLALSLPRTEGHALPPRAIRNSPIQAPGAAGEVRELPARPDVDADDVLGEVA
ncbi:MAG: RNA polymerase sigma factor [Pseudonocardia sp.]|nr:RNA polymerase sigma factor [Pseudonocardia sp.]